MAMRHTIDDIGIDLKIEGNGVRVISGDNNVILPNQDLENILIIIKSNYKFLSDYYYDISDDNIDLIDIKLISIKTVLHYLYIYNMWRKIYGKERNRDLKFKREDISHPQTYDIIFNYFKLKYPDKWIDKCSIMMNMSVEDCRKEYTARELFMNR
ncbi:hypothetical protein ACFSKL_04185 [Belliella marina]|uniref:Uncharacterized protein n=1 Tax=Belliella marina TaxID=1644146 RepID=A0ABW4VJN5_9BACT